MSDVLLRERKGAVEVLTIHRPQALNALNAAVLDALALALASLRGDADLRAVVLTGHGRSFVAGADIAQMKDFSPLQAAGFAAKGQAIVKELSALPVPVIAAVNGFALGGGCELAMACDIVLAGPHARFGQPEVKLGVIPGFGGTQRLTRRVGLGRALELCTSARIIKTDEAYAIGLADLKTDGDVVEAALALAAQISANGPLAVGLAKQAIHQNADADLEVALAAERSLFGLCFASNDQSEGMAAFLEKRDPQFTGH